MTKLFFTFCIALTALAFLPSCSKTFWTKYPQDNFVEEIVEEVIHSELGIDIDLTPWTPEHQCNK